MAWLGEEQPFTRAAGKCRIQSEEQPIPTETALRRRAHHHGLTLIKFRENSSWHNQNWPYVVTDADTNGIISHGLDLANGEEAN